MDVSVIGLGAMGAPMASHLLEAGHRLTVTARRAEAAEPLLVRGAQWVPTPAELAGSDVVVTVLPDLPELEEVLAGENGLLGAITSPTVLVICSTSSPGGVRALAERLSADTGGLLHVVDAPVSGGVEGAKAGSLSIFAGGEAADVEAAAAVLGACGQVTHLGPLGAGQVAKACNQLIVAATTAALAESAVLAERAGLDLDALLQSLGGGYAASRLLEVKGPKLATHDHSPASPARLMIKDLGFAADEAQATGTPTPMLDSAQETFAATVAAGLGDADSSAVQALLEQRRR